MAQAVPDWGYSGAGEDFTVPYLWPSVIQLVPRDGQGKRLLDLGSGNGSWANRYARLGYRVDGIEPSDSGLAQARSAYPQCTFHHGLADAATIERVGSGQFDVVTSSEVVEHLYAPRDWARAAFLALKPGGRLVCTTPYHGYLKNLALSVAGKWDWHLKPLWDGGHIKFWSRRTLANLLAEAGFVNIRFRGAGRLPWLWKSMVLAGDTP